MYMHMGLVQMSCVRAYWEMETKLPAFCDVMSRDRFLKLLTLIPFQDNLSVSDDAKKGKLEAQAMVRKTARTISLHTS